MCITPVMRISTLAALAILVGCEPPVEMTEAEATESLPYLIVFQSTSRSWAGEAGNRAGDLFLADPAAGTIVRVNENALGDGPGNEGAFDPSLSADGRFVAFASAAGDLVPGDRDDGTIDIFVHDLSSSTTRKVTSGLGDCTQPRVSGDGRYVTFTSRRMSGTRVYRADLETEVTDPALLPSGYESTHAPAVTYDGLAVAFEAVSPREGGVVHHIYVENFSTGELTFLSAGERPAISADGRYVTFDSEGGVYRWDRDLQVAERIGDGTEVSISADGAAMAWHSADGVFVWETGTGVGIGPGRSARITLDARRVVFVSAGEIYAYDRVSLETTLVSAGSDGESWAPTVPGR